MKDFLARIGTFFLLFGIVLMLLFIASDANAQAAKGSTNYSYLCASVSLLFVGFLFRRTATPPQAAERFKYIKKLQAQREAAKKEKAKAQQKKK
jgi:cell shape-determining protein MreC